MTPLTIFTKNYSLPEIDRQEVLRYMGCREFSEELDLLYSSALGEISNTQVGKVCYAIFPVVRCDDHIDLGFSKTQSKALTNHLDGCDEIILFAATVGIEYDRTISKFSKISPSMALCADAIGNERIERLCDLFCEDMQVKFKKNNRILRSRFSAGYGDLPLELQNDIFSALSPYSRIGLTLNDSLLMSPTKSVSAIIGIKNI